MTSAPQSYHNTDSFVICALLDGVIVGGIWSLGSFINSIVDIYYRPR